MAKPKPVEFDMDKAMAMFKHLPGTPDLFAAVMGGVVIERLYDLGEINAETLALAQIENFSRGLDEGRFTADEVSECFQNDGEKTIRIPLSFFKTIGAGWRRYMNGPAGSSLGEAFQVEGGGSGRQKARDRLIQRVTDYQFALLVFGLRKHNQDDENPISIETACGIIATVWSDMGTEISIERIQLAYKRYGPRLVEETAAAMKRLG